MGIEMELSAPVYQNELAYQLRLPSYHVTLATVQKHYPKGFLMAIDETDDCWIEGDTIIGRVAKPLIECKPDEALTITQFLQPIYKDQKE